MKRFNALLTACLSLLLVPALCFGGCKTCKRPCKTCPTGEQRRSDGEGRKSYKKRHSMKNKSMKEDMSQDDGEGDNMPMGNGDDMSDDMSMNGDYE